MSIDKRLLLSAARKKIVQASTEFRWRHLIVLVAGVILLCFGGVILLWSQQNSPVMTRQERSWTVIAFLGLAFTSWLIDDSVKNLQALYKAIRQGDAYVFGPRWWLAVGSVVSSIGMYIVWLSLAILGAIVLQTGPYSPPETRLLVGEVAGHALMLMATILLFLQVWYILIRWLTRSFANLPHTPWWIPFPEKKV